MFLDPFYSPGSDFIAIGNTYITDLIARDRAGRADRRSRARLPAALLLVLREHAVAVHGPVRACSAIPRCMPVKVIWDYTYYWGMLCQLFFQRRLTDVKMLSPLSRRVERQQGAQSRDAGLHARLVAAQRAPQRRGAARPGAARLVRRAESWPARRARRRRVRGTHPRDDAAARGRWHGRSLRTPAPIMPTSTRAQCLRCSTVRPARARPACCSIRPPERCAPLRHESPRKPSRDPEPVALRRV